MLSGFCLHTRIYSYLTVTLKLIWFGILGIISKRTSGYVERKDYEEFEVNEYIRICRNPEKIVYICTESLSRLGKMSYNTYWKMNMLGKHVCNTRISFHNPLTSNASIPPPIRLRIIYVRSSISHLGPVYLIGHLKFKSKFKYILVKTSNRTLYIYEYNGI